MKNEDYLECSNKECSTRSGEDVASFSVNVVVDETGGLVEGINEIPSEFFECNTCHSKAEREVDR